MQIEQLGRILSDNLAKASPTDRVTTIHLFGIVYAKDIGSAAAHVAVAAGIEPSYGTEIRKGMKLSKFVTIR